uniref:SMP-LTD domain-containing protein n=1 Tax=Photinus pyralis TaxID=7054 RepID=A0A1Y1M9S9_PHOPY
MLMPKYIILGVSNTDLSLKVELKGFVGTLVLNMPPPPSDRVWIGFRPLPQLWLSAHPIVGERNFSFIKQLTTWIEKKLTQEFQKVLVIPNMEDIAIPVMSSALPT